MKSDKTDVHTTLNKTLYKDIKILAVKKGCDACDLIEEGMKYVISKYKEGKKNE